MNGPVLCVRDLSRRFGDKIVLSDIEIEARRGEVVAIVGANGSGKTTLLRCLATLLLPSGGDAWIGGHSVTHAARRVRALIGWVPATELGFAPRLTGRENLRLFGSMRALSSRQIEMSVDRLACVAALRDALRTPFQLCSSGMKQTLHLARALLACPAVLLADEPTRSLDADAAAQVHSALLVARDTSLIVLSTHSSDERRALGARELLLRLGGRTC